MNRSQDFNDTDANNFLSKYGFHLGFMILLVPAATLFLKALGLSSNDKPDISAQYFTLSCVLSIVAVILLCVPAYVDRLGRRISDLPKGLSDALSDLDNIRREYLKFKMASEDVVQESRDLFERQTKAQRELTQVANSVDEMLTLRQEHANLNRRIQDMIDDIRRLYEAQARFLEGPGISSEQREGIERVVKNMDQCFESYLRRIAPEAGHEFNPQTHKAIDSEPSSDLPEGSILRCKTWGFRTAEKVLSWAEVVLVAKEQLPIDPVADQSEQSGVESGDAEPSSETPESGADNQDEPDMIDEEKKDHV